MDITIRGFEHAPALTVRVAAGHVEIDCGVAPSEHAPELRAKLLGAAEKMVDFAVSGDSGGNGVARMGPTDAIETARRIYETTGGVSSGGADKMK